MSTSTKEYRVVGMSCDHCVASVTEEVSALQEVTAVQVELDGGRLLVAGDSVTDGAVAAAVAEAGYEVAA
ncbi:MAG: heavy-metal-associated domain-containing protein [Thermoleophilaceae bacterium]